jgi:ferredoxin
VAISGGVSADDMGAAGFSGRRSRSARTAASAKRARAKRPDVANFRMLSLPEMANKDDRYPDGANAAGRFYVDTQCIDCDVCRVTAPSNFTREEDKGYSYVFKQPESPEEEAQCQEAMDSCPVEAIGNDGE